MNTQINKLRKTSIVLILLLLIFTMCNIKVLPKQHLTGIPILMYAQGYNCPAATFALFGSLGNKVIILVQCKGDFLPTTTILTK